MDRWEGEYVMRHYNTCIVSSGIRPTPCCEGQLPQQYNCIFKESLHNTVSIKKRMWGTA